MAKLTKGDLARVFLRSLAWQASWSFEGMQSLGFAYAVEPALERLHGREEGLRLARVRHLDFFNTHPYLGAAILGCVVRLEEEGREEGSEEVVRAKTALMGAYGALGDSFFWGGLKPLLALGTLLVLCRGGAWAPWVFVGAFALCNLASRLFFFVQGYRRGLGIAEAVNRLNLLLWARRMKAGCALLLGLLLATLVSRGSLGGGAPWLWAASGAGFTGLVSWLFGKGLNPLWAVYASAALAAAVVTWT